MRKTPIAEPPAATTTPLAPLVLNDYAVFTMEQLRVALGLRKRTLPREVRAGRLCVYRRAGRYFTLGRDVRAWLEGGRQVKGQATG